MPFGSFTPSDHAYADCTRSPNRFVADIVIEAIAAGQLGNAAHITDVPKRVQGAGFDAATPGRIAFGRRPHAPCNGAGRDGPRRATGGPGVHLTRRSGQARIASASRLDRTRTQPGARASP